MGDTSLFRRFYLFAACRPDRQRKEHKKEAPPKRGGASGAASFSSALRAHARYGAVWQIVMFRVAFAPRSRTLIRQISAKMDASTASRIIRMELFSEHAEAAQEPCASRAVLAFIMVVFIVRCFLSSRCCKLTTCAANFQVDFSFWKKHCVMRQILKAPAKKDCEIHEDIWQFFH